MRKSNDFRKVGLWVPTCWLHYFGRFEESYYSYFAEEIEDNLKMLV
jgi:hypothetical protein